MATCSARIMLYDQICYCIHRLTKLCHLLMPPPFLFLQLRLWYLCNLCFFLYGNTFPNYLSPIFKLIWPLQQNHVIHLSCPLSLLSWTCCRQNKKWRAQTVRLQTSVLTFFSKISQVITEILRGPNRPPSPHKVRSDFHHMVIGLMSSTDR